MTKTIRVLHLSSAATWRGGEQQIAYLIEELTKKGVACWVACRSGSAFEEHCIKKGIPFLSLPFKNTLDIFTSQALKKYSKQQRIDVVHAHTSITHSLAVWASVLGCKADVVVSRRIDNPIKKKWLTLFKYRHPSVKRILCISGAIRHVVNATVQRPEKTVTAYSGIDLGKFSEKATFSLKEKYGIPQEKKLIGNVSALADHKDYFTFIDTAELLLKSNDDLHFMIVGEGEERGNIEEYITKKGLQQTITLTGFMKNVPQVLPQLDLFLFTSKTEGLGTTLLDAVACRLPIVATRAGGIPEVIIDGQTGLSCEVGDAVALAQKAERLLADEALQKELTENAYRHLLDHFTKEKMAEANFEQYRQILKN